MSISSLFLLFKLKTNEKGINGYKTKQEKQIDISILNLLLTS